MRARRRWSRTFILLGIVLELPLVARAIGAVTATPKVEEVTIDGVHVEISRPGGVGPWPAFVFITGAHPDRRREPVVQRVARGLARAGFVVAVPDLPGLGEGEVTRHTFESARRVTRAISELPEVRGGRIALAGASTGAGISLVTAADPALASSVSVVCSIVPYADIQEIIRLATTDSHSTNSGPAHPVTILLRRTVGRSLVSALPDGADRDRLIAPLRAVADDDIDPLRHLGGVAVVTPEARAVVDLLLNRDATRFPALYEALPLVVIDDLEALSPIRIAADVQAPVETIVPPSDPYFPIEEAIALSGRHPRGRITVTGVLDHTRPSLTAQKATDIVVFLRWTARCLGTAAS